MIQRYRKNGLFHITLSNRFLSLTVLPEFGGKIITLQCRDSGTEFLLQPVQEYHRNMLPSYGTDYLRFGPAGFDECFPTVAASHYRGNPGTSTEAVTFFPDHGELWAIPWDHWVSDDAISLEVHGVRFAYTFSKTIRVQETSVLIEYQLMNNSAHPFHYIWTAQPFLAIQPGARILLEEEITEVLLDWTTDPNLGHHGAILPWPHLRSKQSVDYTIIQPHETHLAMKLYTHALTRGNCGYVTAMTGEQLLFSFDPNQIPYVGLLYLYNARPNLSGDSFYTVAIQPSTGRPDALHRSCDRQECSRIEANAMHEWQLSIQVY